jgi:hypothetical protein
MISNLEKYKKDLKRLIKQGKRFYVAMFKEYHTEEFEKIPAEIKDDAKSLQFSESYQAWYSESLVLIKQLLPDRFEDFKKYYEKPKAIRKEITHENYTIGDCLIGFANKSVKQNAAIPRFEQQRHILESVERRFESSLFDIKQLVRADIFDSELEAAKDLNEKGFLRGAGAIAGVVLENHLSQVCDNHSIKIKKKSPTISDYNDKLKENEVYETSYWRKIQYLGDLRNLCSHKKEKEPKSEQIEELIEGVEKVIKNIF